jgi:hypothetical protein
MGKRGADVNRLVLPEGFRERVATLFGEGRSRREIIKVIEGENWTCANSGRKIGECSVRSVLRSVKETAIPSVLKGFVRDLCVCSAGRRAQTSAVWSAFQGYAAAKGQDVSGLTRRKTFDLLKVAVRGLRFEKSMGEKSGCVSFQELSD